MHQLYMIVKCDFCKKTIKETNSMAESVAGGTCKKCHDDYLNGHGKKWDY